MRIWSKKAITAATASADKELKNYIRDAIETDLFNLEGDALVAQIVDINVPSYDGDWCSSEAVPELERMKAAAIDALTDYYYKMLTYNK